MTLQITCCLKSPNLSRELLLLLNGEHGGGGEAAPFREEGGPPPPSPLLPAPDEGKRSGFRCEMFRPD